VYFGTTRRSGDEQKLGTTAQESWNLPTLAKSTKFYWKIVTRDANGSTSSPVWSFTTRD
jgi:hypothetical protein